MAEHEAPESSTATTRAEPRRRARELRAPVVNGIAGVVRWIGLLFAIVLVVHVILTVADANPANTITRFVHAWADLVVIGFKDLFLISDDAKLQVLVNYGAAAIVWLIVTAVIARLIRRLA